jgi:hypothetical protein
VEPVLESVYAVSYRMVREASPTRGHLNRNRNEVREYTGVLYRCDRGWSFLKKVGKYKRQCPE